MNHTVNIEKTLTPTSIEELMVLVTDAKKLGVALLPEGGGSKSSVGMPVQLEPRQKSAFVVSTKLLKRIDDYPSEDMTITIEAGITVAELEHILREKGQQLPIDVSAPKKATLGGILATNQSGSRRYGLGTLRDYVIGIDVVTGTGDRVHGGGRVVKNVAGYDFMKLHTGALGTLGIIAQVTLKVRPIAESKGAVVFSIGDAESVLSKINDSATRPIGVDVLHPKIPLKTLGRVSTKSGKVGIVLFEETTQAVNWQIETLTAELESVGVANSYSVVGGQYDTLLQGLTDWSHCQEVNENVFTISTKPSKIIGLLDQLEQTLGTVIWQAHAGNGIATISSPAPADQIIRAVQQSAAKITSIKQLSVATDPDSLFFFPEPGEAIMRKIKDALDPAHLFNPGRLPFLRNPEPVLTK